MTEHTPGPWVQFTDQGKCIAIMRAGHEADICVFQQSPTDADARLMTAVPMMVKALTEILEANKDFRAAMPSDWEGDPLQDACERATGLLAVVGRSLDQGERS